MQSRSRVLVDAILEAAARRFDERGYDRTTTSDVAALAGVSVGSLFQYFPSKRSLITALHERHAREVDAALADALADPAEGTPTEHLTRTIGALLAAHRRHPRLQVLLHRELPSLQVASTDSPARRQTAAQLERWVAGRRPNADPAELSRTTQIVGRLGEALLHSAVLEPLDGVSDADLVREIVRVLEAYVGS